MGLAGGGTQSRCGLGDIVLRQRDHIHVALHHQYPLQFAVGLARLVQPVELASLGEDRGFGRVQVLGLVVAEHPAAEGDNAAPLIPDGKHDAVPKPVIGTPGLVLHQHAGLEQQFALLLAAAQGLQEVIPTRRGEAQVKALGNLTGEAALLEVGDGAAGFGVGAQLLLVVACGLFQQRIQWLSGLLAARLRAARA